MMMFLYIFWYQTEITKAEILLKGLKSATFFLIFQSRPLPLFAFPSDDII